MDKQHSDQADGLRRLLAENPPLRVVSFLAGCPGVGKTSLIANIAVCLARQGREVLIVDENRGKGDMLAQFGIKSAHDLVHALNKDMALADVLVQPTPHVSVIPAARAIAELGGLSLDQQQVFLDSVKALANPIDVVLVDTSYKHKLGFSPLGLAAEENVIVLSGKEDAITETYAMIKMLSLTFARRKFRLVINKVKGMENAKGVFDNLAQLTKLKKLGKVNLAGVVPFDESWQLASKICMPVITAYPEATSSLILRELVADLLHWPDAQMESGSLPRLVERLLLVTKQISPVAS